MILGVLQQVLDKCVEGASVREICIYGDELLVDETSKVFKREKELKKGNFLFLFCSYTVIKNKNKLFQL